MTFALGRKAIRGGYRVVGFDTIGSTSSEALARARRGDPGRLWIVAVTQTAGHGRRGRPWQTPRGNLAASLLLPLPENCARPATLGFAAGLALHRAISRTAPHVASRLRLKWPNDLLIDGAKVAGILLEAVTMRGDAGGVVIGIGVNVGQPPANLSYPAASLADGGAATRPQALFQALSDDWVEHEELWNGGEGFAAVRGHWLERAAGVGLPIAVRWGADEVSGIFETIGEDGCLVVRTSDGLAQKVAAGDVQFGSAATVER